MAIIRNISNIKLTTDTKMSIKSGTYRKTITIPAKDIDFFIKTAKERGWKEDDLATAKTYLLNSPRGKGTMSSEEISAEIKAYRYGNGR